jgi:hypothetical protein
MYANVTAALRRKAALMTYPRLATAWSQNVSGNTSRFRERVQ